MQRTSSRFRGALLAALFWGTLAPVSAEPIKIGFIPLTDSASVVMAQELGLYKKYGVDVVVEKQSSWANVRDKLLVGELAAAHCLFGMPFSVYEGIGGPKGKELKIAMLLSVNGQATTLSTTEFAGVGYGDLAGFKAAVEALKAKKEVTFAMTFPGGTHDLWLRYELAAAGVDLSSVKVITIPPPQMVANMKVGTMDGFNVGEPWGGVAVKQNVGFTWLATQDLWKDHPEKALVFNPDFVAAHRDQVKAIMKAVLEASAYVDDPKNKAAVAKVIGGPAYVNAPADVIDARLSGAYDLGSGLGQKTFGDDTMKFSDGGKVNFPRLSYGIWFQAQYARFYPDKMAGAEDFQAVSKKLILQDLYTEVAKEMKVPVPADDMKPITMKLDGVVFDPAKPLAAWKK
ncbi:MAG TPA: CmpA/NrtA family ABC transporter substrate-binding protein [Spirochaetia bacterium]|jgi:nitrate/nitrite transport system substrate-binding protein|nr:CmpA/NrtA family ABC transporter substrate-binding protein [Spirochaetia bacterium]